ncbi:hypothetical protein MHYP_G00289980 [Metynnis hypsauchen]
MGLPLVAEFHLDIFYALRLPPMMTSLVFPVREMLPNTITLLPPKDVTLSVPVHVLLTPAQMGLMVKGSHGRPPGSPMRPEIGCVQSVPDCLDREPSAISSCKP